MRPDSISNTLRCAAVPWRHLWAYEPRVILRGAVSDHAAVVTLLLQVGHCVALPIFRGLAGVVWSGKLATDAWGPAVSHALRMVRIALKLAVFR